jgi:hypothetical protein
VTGIIAFGGKGLIRLIELLEEEDSVISGYALSILLQICTLETGRDALLASANVPKYLGPLIENHGTYGRRGFQRGILVAAALCRQQDWWAYDPSFDISPFVGQKRKSDSSVLRRLILCDIVRTMKNPTLENCYDLTLADLNVLPLDRVAAIQFSKVAEDVGARAIAEFVCHPDDEGYFESLPWDESIAGCVILEGLTVNLGTVENVFSAGAMHYLGMCLRLTKVMLLGPPMSDRQTVMLLIGVSSAANALAQLSAFCSRSTLLSNSEAAAKIIQDSDVMTATQFFIGTLKVNHPQLEEGTRLLQQGMAISVVKFFGAFSKMLLDMDKDSNNPVNTKSLKVFSIQEKEDDIKALGVNPQLLGLLSAGLETTQLMKCLPITHGKTERMFEILNELCSLLSRLTVPRIGTYTAINDWKIVDALKVNLPAPLSSVGELGVRDILYQTGLGALPASYFIICANLCQMEVFKVIALNEGFLRRALEKVTLLAPILEDSTEFNQRVEASRRGDNCPVSGRRTDVCACLQLIAACANYQSEGCGSTNDLILLADYNIMKVCRDIIAIEECPRSDLLLLAAAATLATLTKNNIRLSQLFQDLELLELILSQFERLEDSSVDGVDGIGRLQDFMPDQLVSSSIEMLVNIVSGMWADKLAMVIQCVREPLARVSRIRTQFSIQVRMRNQ